MNNLDDNSFATSINSEVASCFGQYPGRNTTYEKSRMRILTNQPKPKSALVRSVQPHRHGEWNLESRVPLIREILNSPGERLDHATHIFMRQRFGHDFSRVRIHHDAKAAASARTVNALAYAVGNSVVFGAGRFEPKTNVGRRLLAHELAHVIQHDADNSFPTEIDSADSASEKEAENVAKSIGEDGSHRPTVRQKTHRALARKGDDDASLPAIERNLDLDPHHAMDAPAERELEQFGDSGTRVPVANEALKPQTRMGNELKLELSLFDKANLIADWIAKKLPSADAGNGPIFSLTPGDVFADQELIQKMSPVPKAEMELQPVFEMLVDYGVLSLALPPDSKYTAVIDEKTRKLATGSLKSAQSSLGEFFKKFERRVAEGNPARPLVATELLPLDWSADRGKVKSEKDESDRAMFRTFARPVVSLLTRLRKRNTSWLAGTYPKHSWGEFSVDIFLTASKMVDVANIGAFSGRYYDPDVVRTFFDDLNAVADEETPDFGKCAWRAIYNDTHLAAEINKKYGAGRVLTSITGHGPAGLTPDIHIHLDIAPLKLRPDATSGYERNLGRIQILKQERKTP